MVIDFIVAQTGYSQAEAFAARMYAAIPVRAGSLERISDLPRTGWMPVGTVEFCREAMRHQGIQEPEALDYPTCLRAWLAGNGMRLGTLSELPPGWSPEHPQGIHAKPVVTKLDESSWFPETPFWIGDWVPFQAEFRAYVLAGTLQGVVRYDDGDAEEVPLSRAALHGMIAAYTRNGAPAGYALDVGVRADTGDTCLVEVNDGWALGFYPRGECTPQNYLRLLENRWTELLGNGLSGFATTQAPQFP